MFDTALVHRAHVVQNVSDSVRAEVALNFGEPAVVHCTVARDYVLGCERDATPLTVGSAVR
jgi:hypothetical protein